MGLLASIQKMRLGLKGITPSIISQSLPSSTMHNTTSINGRPALKGIKPSRLDLDGITPKKYTDNLPR